MTDPGLLQEFERRFRADDDPWSFSTSAYERAKRAATIAACGSARRARILELGAANGVLAAELASLGEALVAVEAVPAAAALARARLADEAAGGQTAVVEGLIPRDVPEGPYDLVVASEILYYLEPEAYAATLEALSAWLAPGGRLVAVHWAAPGAERPRSARAVHDDLRAVPWLRRRLTADTERYLLSAFDRVDA